MSEDAPAVVEPVVVVAPEAETDEPFDKQRALDKITKANNEAKGLRSRVKELEAYEAKVREIEDAKKPEMDRLSERATKAEQRAQELESNLIRERIARRHSISDDDLDLLGSGSEEQIEARAQRIAALKAASTPAPVAAPPSDRSREQLRPGATPAEAPNAETDAYPADWLPARAQ